MNRTFLFVALAGVLALIAVVIGAPVTSPPPTVETPKIKAPPEVETLPEQELPPATTGAISMQGRLSHPYVAAGQNDVFVTVDLTGVEVPGAQRAPVHLALVIDRSGSMSGQKLEHAKAAAVQLLGQLTPEDRLAIVHYGSDVRYFPSSLATPENRGKMFRFIQNITDRGGTNIGAALNIAQQRIQDAELQMALSPYSVKRVILISDGQPTEGVTHTRVLSEMARNLRLQGVTVSAIGVGTDFNEDLMQAIAELGAGSYAYLRDSSMLAKVFESDLQQATTTIARDVRLRFQLPQGVAVREVFGYHHTQNGTQVEVQLPDFSAGQVEKLVARLTVQASLAGQSMNVASLKLSYQDLLANGPGQSQTVLAAQVTDQAQAVLANRDAQAVVTATRALTAANYRLAAEKLQRGDAKAAEGYLKDNVALFDMAEEVAGAEAMAPDRDDNNAAIGVAAAAPMAAPEEQADQAKEWKRQALKKSGRGASVR